MTKEEIRSYLEKNTNLDDLYKEAREKLADRIKKDKTFLEDYMNLFERFKTKEEMLDNLAQDAVDAGIEESELEAYPKEWLSWITRI